MKERPAVPTQDELKAIYDAHITDGHEPELFAMFFRDGVRIASRLVGLSCTCGLEVER